MLVADLRRWSQPYRSREIRSVEKYHTSSWTALRTRLGLGSRADWHGAERPLDAATRVAAAGVACRTGVPRLGAEYFDCRT
jgi:hypothetical protein